MKRPAGAAGVSKRQTRRNGTEQLVHFVGLISEKFATVFDAAVAGSMQNIYEIVER